MPQQPKLPRALPPEPDDRIRTAVLRTAQPSAACLRLINLTARLVDKMLAQEPQDPTQPRSVPDEQ